MYGKPPDAEGQCNAHLYLGDDYGDNTCTCRCGLPKGHDGPHKEVFEREGKDDAGLVTIQWERDERPAKEKRDKEAQEYSERRDALREQGICHICEGKGKESDDLGGEPCWMCSGSGKYGT